MNDRAVLAVMRNIDLEPRSPPTVSTAIRPPVGQQLPNALAPRARSGAPDVDRAARETRVHLAFTIRVLPTRAPVGDSLCQGPSRFHESTLSSTPQSADRGWSAIA